MSRLKKHVWSLLKSRFRRPPVDLTDRCDDCRKQLRSFKQWWRIVEGETEAYCARCAMRRVTPQVFYARNCTFRYGGPSKSVEGE